MEEGHEEMTPQEFLEKQRQEQEAEYERMQAKGEIFMQEIYGLMNDLTVSQLHTLYHMFTNIAQTGPARAMSFKFAGMTEAVGIQRFGFEFAKHDVDPTLPEIVRD